MKKSILAIETCSESCSVALEQGDSQLQLLSTEPRGHADNILPMVQQLLADFELRPESLDAIAFTRGPGAFTGVRIGTSVAQGLSLASDVPLIAVSSLAVLAQGSYRETGNERCLAALDARMAEVYFGVYRLGADAIMVSEEADQVAAPANLKCVSEAEEVAQQHLWQAMGPGWNNYSDLMKQRFNDWRIELPEKLSFPQAIDLLPIAQWHYEKGKLLDPEDALPVYVRDQVVRS